MPSSTPNTIVNKTLPAACTDARRHWCLLAYRLTRNIANKHTEGTTVPGMFQPCGTESHELQGYCFHRYGPEFSTHWLVTSEKNREPGKGFSTTRPMTLARKLQNLTILAYAVSPMLSQILRYNPSTTQYIVSPSDASSSQAQYQPQNDTAGCMGHNCHRALLLRGMLVKPYDQRLSKPFRRNNIHHPCGPMFPVPLHPLSFMRRSCQYPSSLQPAR